MTFIRTKDLKGHKYKYLVKNVRIDDKVMQKVVSYLGPINPIYMIKKKRKSNAWLFARTPIGDEEKELRTALKSSSAFTKDRAQTILLSSQRYSCKEIAMGLCCDERKVRLAIKAFNEKGLKSLERGKAKGAKPKFTKEQHAKMLMIASTEPSKLNLHFTTWSLPKLKRYFIENKIVDYISLESVRRLMKSEGIKIRKSKRFQYSNDPEFAKKNY